MASLPAKKITLQVYSILNDDVKRECSDLFSLLEKKLSQKESANHRRLSLSTSSSEEDLLSAYAINENFVYGIMWRISPSKEIASIPDALFESNIVKLPEGGKDASEQSVTILRTSYFIINERYLISTLPVSQIKSLQTYLNWLLSFDGQDKHYNFVPKLQAPKDIKLSQVKKMVFSEASVSPISSNPNAPGVRVIDIASNFLKNIISDVPNLDELIKAKILEAKLLVKFSRPRKMTEEDYEQHLACCLKPIGDIEDVGFELKNQKVVKGKDILCSKIVSVEKLDTLRINEENLIQEMKAYLRAINI